MRLFCGIGINDVPGASQTKEYKLWANMLNRSYDEKLHQRYPAYSDCETSSEFLVFSKFRDWCKNQIGFNLGFELDKDLLEKGNKEYHPEKCVFIPKAINLALKTQKRSRGELPIGVTKKKVGSYIAQISDSLGIRHLGCFSTPEQAFQAYKVAKENHIKLLAEKYRDQIDPRAYKALLNYKVEITD